MSRSSQKALIAFLVVVFGGAILCSLYILLSVVNSRNLLTEHLDQPHGKNWLSATAITREFRSGLLAANDASFDPCLPKQYWKTVLGFGDAGDLAVCKLPRMLSHDLVDGNSLKERLDAVFLAGLIVARLPQESVLAEVLNRTSFGEACGKVLIGYPAALEAYSQKPVRDLTFGEMAWIFAKGQVPAPGDLRQERDRIAQSFLDAKLIDAAELAKIKAESTDRPAICGGEKSKS